MEPQHDRAVSTSCTTPQKNSRDSSGKPRLFTPKGY